jgi:hypothetical protein
MQLSYLSDLITDLGLHKAAFLESLPRKPTYLPEASSLKKT